MRIRSLYAATGLLIAFLPWLHARSLPDTPTYTNRLGMKFVRIEPGTFMMGNADPLPPGLLEVTEFGSSRRVWLPARGDYDERPVHRVTLTRPFYIGITEVTNAQYEQFDKLHVYLRGKNGFSVEDDEAVIYVSWHEAVAFCQWLSEKEGLPYRLPTEAEWEYACRAGTTTPFSTGDNLPPVFLKRPDNSWYPVPERSRGWSSVHRLHVGRTPPNPWGLFDMHGNVEEWCYDWYGPYPADPQIDPVGRLNGDLKVTRGGSHSTYSFYLRSANRSGTVPEDRSWYIGFRIVIGELPETLPLPPIGLSPYQRGVRQDIPANILESPPPNEPYFAGPRRYVKIPPGSEGPLFSRHNHDPAIAECPNGDLLAIWYTTVTERGREVAMAASRLPWGAAEWQEASPFWDAPDRNDHAPALLFDGDRTLYHVHGLSAAATWGPLAILLRTSLDNGVTWSRPRLIAPEHHQRHQPIASMFQTREGFLVLPCDATPGGSGGTALQISTDRGRTWYDPGGTIAGIHAAVTQLDDGRLLAIGRGDAIEGRAPFSYSSDLGKTWLSIASPFPAIRGGQRPILLKLQEGALLLGSFANRPDQSEWDVPVYGVDANGNQHRLSGFFVAVSYDEGRTWPHIRALSPDGPTKAAVTTDGQSCILGPFQGEPRGYMAATQARNGVIHVISSINHYAFNLKWVQTPPAGE